MSIPFLHPGNSPFPCWFSPPRLSILLPSPQSRGAVSESMPLMGHLLPALDLGHFRSRKICHQKSTPSLSLKIIGKCQGTCILGTDLWTACPSDALSLSLCFLHSTAKWKFSNSVTGQSSGILLSVLTLTLLSPWSSLFVIYLFSNLLLLTLVRQIGKEVLLLTSRFSGKALFSAWETEIMSMKNSD